MGPFFCYYGTAYEPSLHMGTAMAVYFGSAIVPDFLARGVFQLLLQPLAVG